ncbi:hypothetical protein [Pseudonocardia sp. NPDC049635]|uniref:hypothetical protein n=1 Tax=Pseudonocardia sp. NPDC049635 TaxID=3155506 RepID=UPI003407D08C
MTGDLAQLPGLVVIAASAPEYCTACRGRRRVELVGPAGIGLPLPCPHCTPGPGRPNTPIVSLPWRQDAPRSTT